jgi:PAS domain S-box-containing protein
MNTYLFIIAGIIVMFVMYKILRSKNFFFKPLPKEKTKENKTVSHLLFPGLNTENSLQENNQNLRHTMDNIMEGSQIIGFDWTYLYINEAAAKQGKHKCEELLGRKMTEMYPGIENTTLYHEIERCMKMREPLQMENVFQFPDGSSGCFELSIEPVPEGVFILSVDITNRKKKEGQKQLLASVVNSSEDAIISKTMDGEIITWNKGAEQIFGYKAIEITGKNIRLLIPPELYIEETEIIEKIKKGIQINHYETKRLHKTGNILDISISVSPVLDERGRIIGASKIARDITHQKKQEQEKNEKKAEEQLLITAAMLAGQERERNAIGVELHDNVNQILVGTNLLLSAIKKDATKAEELLPVCIKHIQQVLDENRKIAHAFIAPDLSKEDLPDQLEKLRYVMLEPAGIQVALNTDNYNTIFVNNEMKLNLYRIAQEQCTNITRYAGASNADIELSCDDKMVRLNISDNGKGMDLNKQPIGVGLRNIESRAKIFRGTVDIITAPGKGFSVKVKLPLAV